MKGEQYLTKPGDFARVHELSRWVNGGVLGIKSCANNLPLSRYGFIVSKRVGGAVVRNQVKRRLREVMRQIELKPGMDIIISARPQAVLAEFSALQGTVLSVLAKVGLLIR
ncbi:MAG: ribonuclease P protein component [Dehalococcoidia bacterium]|nr:ribonuclease P protein component [Dehalococcoidia bacterium]